MFLCIFKNVIDYYHSSSSPVFICYVDASKAFDRVNYWLLFKKLLKRGVHHFVVKLSAYWYSHQCFQVLWDSCLSKSFNVSNGVRQGGVLSPYLFNVYTNDLSIELNTSGVGCLYNDVLINHLFYADDAALLAPSAGALQKLINICECYAEKCDILFNVKKTVVMCIKPKWMAKCNVPNVFINGEPLKYVSFHKYLGNIMCSDFKDDLDITNSLRGIYGRGNMLLKNFKFCTTSVKSHLFKTFCSSFYGMQTWCNFKGVSLRKLRTAYNNVFRFLMKLPAMSSISYHMVYNDVDHFNVIHRNILTCFIKRLSHSSNHLVSTVFNSMCFMYSTMNTTWLQILLK